MAFDFDRDAPTGAASLSWTAPWDGWLVREISAASPGIFAASYDNAGQRQDYDNDLNALAAAGLTGAHFDSFSGQDRYHTLRDNLASADQRALQDVGDAMLALTRHFGDIPIGETKAEDEVFTLFGSGILHYARLGAAGAARRPRNRLGHRARAVAGPAGARPLGGATLVLALGAGAAAGAALLVAQLASLRTPNPGSSASATSTARASTWSPCMRSRWR